VHGSSALAATWSRHARIGLPLTLALAGLLLLILLPKKYPRLLVPLLPLGACWLAAHLARWSPPHRGAALGLLGLSLLANTFALGPLSAGLGVTRLGLVDVDERCFQSWVEPPSAPGLDWDNLLLLLESAGGKETEYRVGAAKWPVPPCSYQTTHDLGQHLRVRVRRRGLSARVMAGVEAWQAAETWGEEAPRVLISDGPEPCGADPSACRKLGTTTLVGRLDGSPPGWPVELFVWRVNGGDP
jgi:hypothetical protein